MKIKTDPVKFLLVDDQEANLIALEALLHRDGLEILKARSGVEALELVLEHDFALALIDVQMPEMDGFALAELMRGSERSRHVPIIFVTAGAQEQHHEFRGYDAGAVDFLFKPVDPRILRHKTETFYQLYRQRQQLEGTLHLVETFMAAVGHDLRTPLNAVSLATELILHNPEAPANKRVAERIRSSSKRMQRMIDDLFDLARVRLGEGLPLDVAPADLGAITKRVTTEVETAHPGRKITLDAKGDTHGEWDAPRLAQVVQNLVANAIRHGASTAPIDVAVSGADEFVRLRVHNGGAIAPEAIPNLFDPFRSSADKKARAEGLGLGLFIVHQIVLAHGGTIDVSSDPEAGTTFDVVIPRRPPPDSTPPPRDSQHLSAPSA